MKVYVASSWRNVVQPAVVRRLHDAGFDVYDFRSPDEPGGTPGGFQWSEIDPDWKSWSPEKFREQLEHPLATRGAGRDLEGLLTSDAVLAVMPCGRSAHLELGYALGTGKIGIVYVPTDPGGRAPGGEVLRAGAHVVARAPCRGDVGRGARRAASAEDVAIEAPEARASPAARHRGRG